jgi:squalene cyclase
MATGYVLSDVVTKAAYFGLTAAAFVFVAMLLLTGLHL